VPLAVYFDEVGNPSLDPSDKDFPVFAVAMFICDIECYMKEIIPRANALKFRWFGHEGVILHSRDIRKAQGDFAFLCDPVKRAEFMSELSELMTSCNYSLLAVAIRKDQHSKRYKYPADPYDLSLVFAMERLVSVLEGAGQTEVTIIAEQRGKKEDRELYLAFQCVFRPS